MYSIHTEIVLPCSRERVFSFFSDPHNLEIITPEWLRFRVLSRGIEMKLGSFIDYRLRLRGIPIRWQSEITTWNPPYCFVDQQCRGPYTEWIHTRAPTVGGNHPGRRRNRQHAHGRPIVSMFRNKA